VLSEEEVFAVLSASARPGSLRQIAKRALDHCALQARARGMERELELYTRHLKELNHIGVALSSERDLDTLLELILTKSRAITNSDASSLYLVEQDPAEDADGKSRLRFKLSQNDSLTFSVNQPMPISSESLAGYVALTGESLRFEDVYEIGPEVSHRFNRSFDISHGYRTKSMLVVPMRNHKNDIIGVLQLINRKTHRRVRLENRSAVEREVLPFSDLDLETTESLASQAAVAIENSSLHQDIENLFEGFVTASARAIEQRDPTTSGHSERVAILTVELAGRISHIKRGRFSDLVFTPTQIKEMRYAALLHDFGKVGVREDVLLKRNKLHEHEFDMLRMRFEMVRMQRERDLATRKVQALQTEDRESLPGQFQVWDKELEDEMHDMDEFLTLVTRANDPLLQWMSDEEFERQQNGLARLRHVYYCDRTQNTRPLLNDYELCALSVRRGSLDEVERREIECHVTHTFEFLNQIPWTREYEMVPRIAYCHHERCNGTGYPRGLMGIDISLQARMMTIVDIYDALTAADRPYKKACTSDRAIDILYQEAQDGNIDRDVLDIFVTYQVWKLTQGWKKRS
jgi:HD-GYP domain-containing protein (c-di-GMP phosphodiesterase class II)